MEDDFVMGKMNLDIIFQKTNFIIGIIGMVLSILWLSTLRVNKRKVIQSKGGAVGTFSYREKL